MPIDRKELAPLIAVIGCDGSGKSTVSEEILAWVSSYGPAETAHLGKQSGNIGRAVARWPLIGPWLDRLIVRKTDKTRTQRAGKKAPGFFVALVLMAFLLRRLRRFQNMLALRRKGLIIVTDRYPQLDLLGASDSTDLSATASGSAVVRWLARRELAAYEWMTSFRPDLVIRLNVDLDTACARKPDHRRELLRDKVAAIPLLKFNGAPIVDVDATLPLDEVLAAAKTAVTHTLTERGYTSQTHDFVPPARRAGV
ncbi:thymidylate kinase [Candidatus Nitrotoga sp. M5]|uniref:thymidylate kinase n=1 Tax=Candidatus Nitrotoga sp. M5 TaxID=2890409 RepID=UPI001EF39741|nr:thymidylate kinase [Candidatus Nitrotoga sp. M5]CAH1386700.1 putative ATP-binding protein YghT [Candidatus Nitrotoga sp. M5]